MEFDRFSVALFVFPLIDHVETRRRRLNCMMLADLHEAGYLFAAGPLLGGSEESFRGPTILNVEPEKAPLLKEQDPAIKAGRFSVKILPWIVPRGAIHFSPANFPRSLAETIVD